MYSFCRVGRQEILSDVEETRHIYLHVLSKMMNVILELKYQYNKYKS